MMLRMTSRFLSVAIAAAMTLTSVDLRPAVAAPQSKAPAVETSADSIELSSRKRRGHRHHHGNAAGLAMFGLTLGTIAAIAAAQRERRHHRRYHYYYGGYPYYGGHYGYHPGYYRYSYRPYW